MVTSQEPFVTLSRALEQAPGEEGWARELLAHEKRLGFSRDVTYGGLQFSSVVVDAETGAARLNTGQTRYGNIGFVLKPEAAARSTFLANDSFYVDSRPGGVEQIDQIVGERLLRNYRIFDDHTGISSPWSNEPRETVVGRFFNLLKSDRKTAVAELKQLFSSEIPSSHYVETETPNVSMDDVQALVIESNPTRAGWHTLAQQRDGRIMIDRIKVAAEERGVPVYYSM